MMISFSAKFVFICCKQIFAAYLSCVVLLFKSSFSSDVSYGAVETPQRDVLKKEILKKDSIEVAKNTGPTNDNMFSFGGWMKNLLSPIDTSTMPRPPPPP